ncbi:MAG: hypothetical protein WA981_06765 [Glaciecola sp.]
MYIPNQFLPIRTAKPKATKRGSVTLERAESDPNGAQEAQRSHAVVYEKREGEDRRKRKMKPLIDTRSGRDRRYDNNRAAIDIKA